MSYSNLKEWYESPLGNKTKRELINLHTVVVCRKALSQSSEILKILNMQKKKKRTLLSKGHFTAHNVNLFILQLSSILISSKNKTITSIFQKYCNAYN